MTYQVRIMRSAQRSLDRVPRRDQERVRIAIRALAQDPRPMGCTSLRGRDGYRVRVGDYRVVYLVEDEVHVVTVTRVGHRREVYR